MMRGPALVTCTLVLALGACTTTTTTVPRASDAGPMPVPATLPAVTVVAQGTSANAAGTSASAAGNSASAADAAFDWRAVILDARLRTLVERALEHNRDLRAAMLGIEVARARYRIGQAQRWPEIDLAAAGRADRSAADLRGGGQAAVSRQASVSVGVAAWELDLWGRVTSLKDAALSSFLASEQTQRALRASLVAEVAVAWFTLAADQRRVQLVEQTLQTRRRSLELAERRKALGAASALDVAVAQSALASARDERAAEDSRCELDRNALRLLLGSELPPELAPTALLDEQGLALLAVPANLPSSVLLRRPDVQAAELELQAARANVAAARAALFPTITLTASAGSASNALGGLFGAGNGTWSFAPALRWPLFDGGAGRAEVAAAAATRDIRLAIYERAVQVAFREVADALAQRAVLGERLAAQADLVSASETTLRLAGERHRLGSESVLALLDAQRTLFAAQQGLITLQLADSANRLVLFKALGGS